MAYMISGIMDKGSKDYQLEAAIGKVYGSESAWYVCDEVIQVLGGMGYMKEAGLERVMRDLRIFRIFEGTNDILRLFVALTGIQYAGSHLKEVIHAMKSANVGVIFGQASKRLQRLAGFSSGDVNLGDKVHPNLAESAKLASECIELFGAGVEALLIKYGKGIIEEQYLLNRLGQAAIDIFAMVTVLSRATRSIKLGAASSEHERLIVQVVCSQASDRVKSNLSVLKSSKDKKDFEAMTQLALDACKHQGLLYQDPLGI